MRVSPSRCFSPQLVGVGTQRVSGQLTDWHCHVAPQADNPMGVLAEEDGVLLGCQEHTEPSLNLPPWPGLQAGAAGIPQPSPEHVAHSLDSRVCPRSHQLCSFLRALPGW